MMSVSLHSGLRHVAVAAALTAVAFGASANSTNDAFVDIAGAAATDGFNDLVASRITTPQLVAGVAANVAGSDGGAKLQRLTGGFYPASFGLYSWSTDSAFGVNVASAVANLGSVTLQTFVSVDTSQGVLGPLQAGYLPTLSFNGGTQKLASTYTVTPVSGGFSMDGTPLEADPNNPNYGKFTWDLSGVTTPITSFSVNFGLTTHASALAFQLDQSVAAAVPEPQTYALMLAGISAVGLIARRRRQHHQG
jgi:hypothetical protein